MITDSQTYWILNVENEHMEVDKNALGVYKIRDIEVNYDRHDYTDKSTIKIS